MRKFKLSNTSKHQLIFFEKWRQEIDKQRKAFEDFGNQVISYFFNKSQEGKQVQELNEEIKKLTEIMEEQNIKLNEITQKLHEIEPKYEQELSRCSKLEQELKILLEKVCSLSRIK